LSHVLARIAGLPRAAHAEIMALLKAQRGLIAADGEDRAA